MRYIVLIIMGILGAVLNNSFFSTVTAMGLQVDILLIMIVSMAILEKTCMPVLFAILSGLLVDMLYSTMIGFHAIGYAVVACAVVIAFMGFKRINIVTVFLAGVGGYIINETVSAVMVYILGLNFNISEMYFRYILPGAIMTGILLMLAYWPMSKLMSAVWMKPRKRHGNDDISHIIGS